MPYQNDDQNELRNAAGAFGLAPPTTVASPHVRSKPTPAQLAQMQRPGLSLVKKTVGVRSAFTREVATNSTGFKALGPIAGGEYARRLVGRATAGVPTKIVSFKHAQAQEMAREAEAQPTAAARIAEAAAMIASVRSSDLDVTFQQAYQELQAKANAARAFVSSGDMASAADSIKAANEAYLRLWTLGRALITDRAATAKAQKIASIQQKAAAAEAAGKPSVAASFQKQAAALSGKTMSFTYPAALSTGSVEKQLSIMLPGPTPSAIPLGRGRPWVLNGMDFGAADAGAMGGSTFAFVVNKQTASLVAAASQLVSQTRRAAGPARRAATTPNYGAGHGNYTTSMGPSLSGVNGYSALQVLELTGLGGIEDLGHLGESAADFLDPTPAMQDPYNTALASKAPTAVGQTVASGSYSNAAAALLAQALNTYGTIETEKQKAKIASAQAQQKSNELALKYAHPAGSFFSFLTSPMGIITGLAGVGILGFVFIKARK